MAHILVAYHDWDMRQTLDEALRDVGHTVTQVGDGVLALAALWVARRPLVVVLDDQLGPLAAADILDLAADAAGTDGGDASVRARLGHHQYIVMTTEPQERIPTDLRANLKALHASLLCLPIDLYDLLDAVDNAARDLPVLEQDAALSPAWPARVALRAQGHGVNNGPQGLHA